jgi:hypothetical protein
MRTESTPAGLPLGVGAYTERLSHRGRLPVCRLPVLRGESKWPNLRLRYRSFGECRMERFMSGDTWKWVIGAIAGAISAVIGTQYMSFYKPQRDAAKVAHAQIGAIRHQIKTNQPLTLMMKAREQDPKCPQFDGYADKINPLLDGLDLKAEDHLKDFLVQGPNEARLSRAALTSIISLRLKALDGFSDAKRMVPMPPDKARLDVLCGHIATVIAFDKLARDTQDQLRALADQGFLPFLIDLIKEQAGA